MSQTEGNLAHFAAILNHQAALRDKKKRGKGFEKFTEETAMVSWQGESRECQEEGQFRSLSFL